MAKSRTTLANIRERMPGSIFEGSFGMDMARSYSNYVQKGRQRGDATQCGKFCFGLPVMAYNHAWVSRVQLCLQPAWVKRTVAQNARLPHLVVTLVGSNSMVGRGETLAHTRGFVWGTPVGPGLGSSESGLGPRVVQPPGNQDVEVGTPGPEVGHVFGGLTRHGRRRGKTSPYGSANRARWVCAMVFLGASALALACDHVVAIR